MTPQQTSGRPQAGPEPTRAILCVDLDADLIQSITPGATAQHIEIDTAGTPAEALRIARARDLSGVVIRAQWEGGDPFQLARMLRAVPGYESLPLAFTSEENVPDVHVASALTGGRVILTRTNPVESLLKGFQDLVAARDAKRPHVLLLEDDETHAHRVLTLIQSEGWVGNVVDDPEALSWALDEVAPGLLVLDTGTQGFNPTEVCRNLRESPTWRDLPIVFLSGRDESGERLAAYQAGADDYIPRTATPEEIGARLRVRLERALRNRERNDVDPLSGLLLRRPFLETLRQQVAFAQRHKHPLTLCLVDVDGFKDLNDRYGRLSGDHVIATLGSILQKTFRSEDLRCRWGGKEFVIAFLESPPQFIEGVMGGLLNEFGGMTFESETGEQFHSSFTVGVASLPVDGDNLQDVIRTAERRRTQGKQIGGGCVVGKEE